MLETYQKNIIELMIKQESLMAKLYKLFAKEFPEHSEFWNNISNDEVNHAIWLRQLYNASENDVLHFDEGKVKVNAMNTYISHQEDVIARTERHELTLVKAVSLTLDMEHSLIEKNVFALFASISEKNRNILKRLILETEEHVRRLQDFKP